MKLILKRFPAVPLFLIVIILLSMFWNKIYLRHPFAVYGSLAFDDQNLLVWDWTARQGIKPFVEIFYPYGLLTYYRNVWNPMRLLYVSLYPLYFVSFFLVLQRVVRRKWLVMGVTLFFMFFVQVYIGFSSFVRYGPLLVLPLLLAFILTRVKRKPLGLFLLGIVVGLFFSFMTDQGIYAGFVCGALILIAAMFEAIEHRSLSPLLQGSLRKLVSFGTGVALGAVPLLIYLLVNNGLADFIETFSYMRDLALFAKTPFIPWFKSPSNLFTFIILIAALNLVAFRSYFSKKKLSFFNLLYCGLVLGIVVLEQKNIIRSNDWQITLLSFPLALVFVLELATQSLKHKLVAGVILIALTVGITTLRQIPVYDTRFPRRANIGNDLVINFVDENNDDLAQVKQWLDVHNPEKKSIFSFPGNPIFYQLVGQKPPYIIDLYQATPAYAQKQWIEYIEDQQVAYLILEPVNAIQDDVPDYVRGATILPYLLTHFKFIDRVGKFLIFERSDKVVDVFATGDVRLAAYTKWLTEVALARIARNEGLHKTKEIRERVFSSYRDLSEVNRELKSQPLESEDLGLAIWLLGSKSDNMVKIRFTTQDNLSTNVTFDGCEDDLPCVINLSHLPLFYLPRKIVSMEIEGAQIGLIQMLHLSNLTSFW